MYAPIIFRSDSESLQANPWFA